MATIEKQLEAKLKREVRKLGGEAIKFYNPFHTGLPDRIVFLPDERMFLVELKSTKGKLSPRQQKVQKDFAVLGFTVHVANTHEKLNRFIQLMKIL